MSRLTVYGAFLLPEKCILCGKPATITHGHAPAVSLDTLQSSGGSFVLQGIEMTAKNGKPCKKCGTSEWYSNGTCKSCAKATCRKQRDAHPEKVREWNRKWRRENPEKARESDRRWRATNSEKERERSRKRKHNPRTEMTEEARERERARDRKRNADNPGRRGKYPQKWHEQNKERDRQRINEWMRSHPEERVRYEHARRSRKSASGGSYTVAEWKGLVAHYGNKCLCCGRSDVALTVDHVVPVSKGGTSNIENLQPLCLSCNSKKQDKIIDYRPGKGLGRWIQQKLFG